MRAARRRALFPKKASPVLLRVPRPDVSRETFVPLSHCNAMNCFTWNIASGRARAVAHMTLPERNTRRHDADEAPRANPCARGIDRNNRKRHGRRFDRPGARQRRRPHDGRQHRPRRLRWSSRRHRTRGAKPAAQRIPLQASPRDAERGSGTQPRRRAEAASAVRRRYVPSRNACAYSTIVERPHHAKNSQIPLRRRTDVSRETSGPRWEAWRGRMPCRAERTRRAFGAAQDARTRASPSAVGRAGIRG